jgi:hypothetical protein
MEALLERQTQYQHTIDTPPPYQFSHKGLEETEGAARGTALLIGVREVPSVSIMTEQIPKRERQNKLT